MTRYIIGVGLAASLATGCSYERGNPNGPTSSGFDALTGNWASVGSQVSRENCSDFQWSITERTATSAQGTFGATCGGDLRINGLARATLLQGNAIGWSADATATNVPVVPGGTCTITLGGTAELGVDSVRINYSGRVCGVEVSGVENLQRR
jgi:hypothetical protein